MTGPLKPPSYALPLVEVSITQLDLSCLAESGAVFDRLLALSPGQVVVDLSECGYLDAAAIGLLLDVHRRLARADGTLVVRNPNRRIQRILHHARLDQVLPIVTEPPSASHGDPALVALGGQKGSAA